LKIKQGVILGNGTGIFYKCMLYDKFRAPVGWGNIKREKYARRKKGKMKAIKGTVSPEMCAKQVHRHIDQA
jgi:hypothetical protein